MRSFLLLSLVAASAAAAEPQSLFDGKTLSGWEGDEKTWRVEDGSIVGGTLDTVVPRNEFLCTTKTYGDFELRVKFKILGDKQQYHAGEDVLARVRSFCDAMPRGHDFGNARTVRNLFEAAIARHANRVVDIEDATREQLCTLLPEDILAPGEPA